MLPPRACSGHRPDRLGHHFRSLFLFVALFALFGQANPAIAQVHGFDLWQEISEPQAAARLPSALKATAKRQIVPRAYRTLALNRAAMAQRLAGAPRESAARPPASGEEILLPLPQGGYGRFRVLESPLMEPALAAQFPSIKHYIVQGIDDRTATGRIDTSPKGFRAMVISATGTFFIDPYWSNSDEASICYAKKDFVATEKMQEWSCGVVSEHSPVARAARELAAQPRPTGASLRIYRAAIAATGEYTAFHGGTVAGALAAINTSLARVNAIYERDFCIRMVLVANNSSIIYTSASTDPYTNDNGSTMLGQNQTNLDNLIGNANYDIGHVFSTGGGGVASLGSVCVTGRKAQGVTGSSSPVGDPFDVDYVAHEMGHQFAGNHTFNATGNLQWNSTTAFEPGSGSTIMAYAGIVSGQDLQPNSDDHFHTGSYTEIDNFTTTGAGRFAFQTNATGNNVPVIAAMPSYTIPARTPFALTASATDADGDALTYCWEEYDLGPQQNPATANPRDNGSSPIFRSYSPTTNATRFFPSLRFILSNSNLPPATYTSNGVSGWATGEAIPTTSRTMTFRVSVRDNRAGGGGHNWASTQVTTVSNAGPFRISSQNTSVSLAAGSPFNVAWDVAGTASAPINAANVKILLSTNGGTNFPIVLAESVPNNGSAGVTIPAGTATTNGRLKVEAVGNIFFDINDARLTVGGTASPSIIANGSSLLTESCANGAVDPGELVTVSLGLLNVGSLGTSNLTARLLDTNGVVAVTTNPVSFGVLAAGGAGVSRNFEMIADGACGSTVTAVLELRDGTNNLGTAPFSFVLGTTSSSTTVFSNAANITIPQVGAGSPYPSSITVAGLPGKVTKATVTLRGFAHAWPEDVDIILVSPTGQKVSLMSGVGGTAAVSNVNVTFDDAAGTTIGTTLATGTYTPSGTVLTMPAPAPAAPYAGALGDLAGAQPNGTWSLYVADAFTPDGGSISGGWSLSLTTAEPVCCEEPVPPVITSPLSASGTVGSAFSYQITAANSPTSFGASGLPPGLVVDAATGLISGTPTTAGTYTASITASNALGPGQATLTIIVARARSVVFSENMGAPSVTTAIANHTFQNSGRQSFSGTADVRISTVSSNYVGASGQGNVFFTANGTASFQISGINTSGYTDLALVVGHFKSAAAANNELAIEVSADGVSYTPLSYNRPTGSGTANWRRVEPAGSIPSTENLRIRFRQTSTSAQFRVDDVVLSGLPPVPPIISAAAATSSGETEAGGGTTYQVVRGTSASLSVAASDEGGEAGLIYTWSATGGAVSFAPNGTNAAKASTATFPAAGDYTLTVTVRNPGGGTATSSVPVRVKQTAASIAVSPATASVAFGGTQSFTAQQRDQFANLMAAQPSFVWSVSGGGTIGSNGLFTAVQAGGPYTVTASANNVFGAAQVTVREWIDDQPFALLVTNPGSPVVTSNGSFAFAGLSGLNITGLLSWSNRQTGQVGTFGKSGPEWGVTVPLAAGINTLDFRGSYEVQEGADSGASSAYADGWTSGDNGGSVFLPWQLQTGPGGDAFVAPDTTSSPDGRLFGLWSGTASSALATRPFPALSGGGAVSLEFRNSGLSAAGRMGFEFADAQGNPRLVFHSAARGGDYRIHDNAGTNTTGWTNDGAGFAALQLSVDSADGYTLRLDGSELSGALLPGDAVAQVKIFSEAAAEAPTLFASDKMQYPAGSTLANQSGGTGFSASWSGGDSTITAGSPPFSAWVRLGTNASTRILSSPVTTGVQPVYLSMVILSGDFTAGNFSGLALTDSGSSHLDRLFIGIPWTRNAFGVDRRQSWDNSDFQVISNLPTSTPHLVVCGLVPGAQTNMVDVKLWTTTNTSQDLSALIKQSPAISFAGAQGKTNFTFNQIKLHGDFAGAMEFAEVGIVDIPARTEYELLFRNLRWESPGAMVSAPSVWFNLAKTDGLPDAWWDEYAIPAEHRLAAGDWDNDGLSNAMEYFTGLDPTADDAAQAFAQWSDQGFVHLDYRRSKVLKGIIGTVKWSLSPAGAGPWSLQGVDDTFLEDQGAYERRRATVPWSPGERAIFLRLDLTLE